MIIPREQEIASQAKIDSGTRTTMELQHLGILDKGSITCRGHAMCNNNDFSRIGGRPLASHRFNEGIKDSTSLSSPTMGSVQIIVVLK